MLNPKEIFASCCHSNGEIRSTEAMGCNNGCYTKEESCRSGVNLSIARSFLYFSYSFISSPGAPSSQGEMIKACLN